MGEHFWPVVYTVLLNLCQVSMQFFLKLLSAHISVQYILTVRSLLLLILNSIFILRSQEYLPYASSTTELPPSKQAFALDIKPTPHFKLMLKRQFLTAFQIIFYLSSLQQLEMSIAQTLFNTSPVIIFFVEAAFYKKSIPTPSLILSMISFAGVVIIIDPVKSLKEGGIDPWLLLPLMGAFCASTAMVYLHEMKGIFHKMAVLEYAYIFQTILCSLTMTVVGPKQDQTPPGQENPYSLVVVILFIVLITVLTYSSHNLRIMAIFKLPPSQTLVYNYVAIIATIILDAVVFNSVLEPIKVLGVFLTSVGLLSNFVMKGCAKEQESQDDF